MIPVYRMQDDEGRGPFRPGFSHRWVEPRPDRDRLRPFMEVWGPQAALERANAGFYVGCACLTIEQLRRWFTAGEYITLRGWGYRAVLLTVDELLHSDDIQSVVVRARPFSQDALTVPLYGPMAHARG